MTDHRINLTLYKLDEIMQGAIGQVVIAADESAGDEAPHIGIEQVTARHTGEEAASLIVASLHQHLAQLGERGHYRDGWAVLCTARLLQVALR